MKLFGHPRGTPEMDFVQIPMKMGRLPILFFPHKWVTAIYAFAAIWCASFLPGPGACYNFWNSMQDSEFVRQHPILTQANWDVTAPCGMHGDAGAFSKQESVYLFTFNSLLGAKANGKRFIFTLIRKSQMVRGTMDAIMKIFLGQ